MGPYIDNKKIGVKGLGYCLPGAPLSNDAIINLLCDSDSRTSKRRLQIIAKRLGIESRHHVRNWVDSHETAIPGYTNPDISSYAIKMALREMAIDELDYLIGHTTSPQTLVPPNIAYVADNLKYSGVFSEFRQACTGFMNGLIMGSGLINSKLARNVAIVGSETGSVYATKKSIELHDTEQMVNLMQMGDGAGAIILTADASCAYIDTQFFCYAGLNMKPGLSLKNGGSAQPWSSYADNILIFEHDFNSIKENGLGLFSAAYNMTISCGVNMEKIDWILPHQVNSKLSEILGDEFDVSCDRFISSFYKTGNLGSAGIWVALAQACKENVVKPGQCVLVLGAEATKYLYGGFVYYHA